MRPSTVPGLTVVSVSHSLSLKTHADAIAVWALLATIAQRVQCPGFCGAVGAPLSEPLLGSAVKPPGAVDRQLFPAVAARR